MPDTNPPPNRTPGVAQFSSRGTNPDFNRQNKKACELSGGKWDEKTQTCIPPQTNLSPNAQENKFTFTDPKDLVKQTTDNKKMNTPGEATLDPDSNKGAIVLNDGTILVGSNKEIRGLIENQQLKNQKNQGVSPIGTAQNQADQAQQAGQLQAGLSTPPVLTEQDILNAVPQNPNIEAAQQLTFGTTGLLGGATKGAAIGSVAGPTGALIGGIAGTIAGAAIGLYYPIQKDKKAEAKQAELVSKLAINNIIQTANALDAGLITKSQAMERFNDDKVALYAAQENAYRLTNSDLDKFLSGGADEMIKINERVRDFETLYAGEFALALTQPNPSRIRPLQQDNEEAEKAGFFGI